MDATYLRDAGLARENRVHHDELYLQNRVGLNNTIRSPSTGSEITLNVLYCKNPKQSPSNYEEAFQASARLRYAPTALPLMYCCDQPTRCTHSEAESPEHGDNMTPETKRDQRYSPVLNP
eukprot:903282-Pyramimonas_sp.AAC.1